MPVRSVQRLRLGRGGATHHRGGWARADDHRRDGRRRPIAQRFAKVNPHTKPFKFTSNSKQQIMAELARAIQAGEVRYPDGPIANSRARSNMRTSGRVLLCT